MTRPAARKVSASSLPPVVAWLTLLTAMPWLVSCGDERPPRVNLQDLVVAFVEGIPGRGSEAMTLPTPAEEARFLEGVRAARDGDPERAQRLVDAVGYDVVTVVDSATNRRLYVFEERRADDDDPPRGWGLYVIPAGPSRPLVVEVTHPAYDLNTPQVGVAAFRHGRAAALLVAGTHRYANDDGSSDVAHEERSMFAAVNRALVGPGQIVLQPHGFDGEDPAREADDADHGEVVVSAGTTPSPPAIGAVTTALREEGFSVCEYDGDRCSDLGATRNVEGWWCREVGAAFVHLELDREVRDDPTRRALAARTVVDALVRPLD